MPNNSIRCKYCLPTTMHTHNPPHQCSYSRTMESNHCLFCFEIVNEIPILNFKYLRFLKNISDIFQNISTTTTITTSSSKHFYNLQLSPPSPQHYLKPPIITITHSQHFYNPQPPSTTPNNLQKPSTTFKNPQNNTTTLNNP